MSPVDILRTTISGSKQPLRRRQAPTGYLRQIYAVKGELNWRMCWQYVYYFGNKVFSLLRSIFAWSHHGTFIRNPVYNSQGTYLVQGSKERACHSGWRLESGGYLTRCCLAVYVDASPVSPSFLTSLIARSRSLSLPFSLPSISHRPWPPRSPPLQSRPGRWRSVTTVPCLRLTCLRSESRVGIQRRADDNYVRKFCVAVVDLLLNFDHFWKFGHVSKSNINSSARH